MATYYYSIPQSAAYSTLNYLPATHHSASSRPKRRATAPASPMPYYSTLGSSPGTYPVSLPTANPYLEHHSHMSNMEIQYNLSHPPSQAVVSSSRSGRSLSERDLNQPATSPPSSYIRIRCKSMPWTIEVRSTTQNFVTVGDVLEEIYTSLRRRASGTDWNDTDPERQEIVRQAWLRRIRNQQNHRDYQHESTNGLRRIDWLGSNTVFQGLSPGNSRDTWVLHVKQGSKSVKFWAGS